MPKRLIHVTQAHIDNGNTGHSESCPIALALEEKFPGSEPRVGIVHAWLNGNNRKLALPARAINFVQDFDGRKEVQPFKFYLDVPE